MRHKSIILFLLVIAPGLCFALDSDNIALNNIENQIARLFFVGTDGSYCYPSAVYIIIESLSFLSGCVMGVGAALACLKW